MSAKQQRQPQFKSPSFKTGDYVPLALLIVGAGEQVVNYHLPQKLFAIKDFTQSDMMMHYFFQHPQQPIHLDQNRPDIGAFNSAVINLHKWMIANGYARQEGTTNVTARVWSQEEVDAARAEAKANREAQVLAHAEAMAAAGEEGMSISQGVNNLLGAADELAGLGTKLYAEGSLDKLQHEHVNVGTIGHVDHGKSALASMVDRVAPAEPIEAGIPESYLVEQRDGVRIDTDPADPEPEQTRAFIEQELVAHRSVSDGGQAFERSSASADEPEAFLTKARDPAPDDLELMYPTDMERIQPPAVRTPQYPLTDVPAAEFDTAGVDSSYAVGKAE